jgi:cystathionine gamma-lyase
MKICDIAAIAEIAEEANIRVVVDNTFLSPYFQKPLRLGANVVVHSSTKYLNGHSDSVGGAVMLSDEDLYRQLKFNQNTMGAILSPFDSYLVLRGIKTLAVRMREHEQNALRLANYLEEHPKVKKVNYPGLKSHPQHALANRQAKGHGGMLSFEIKGGLEEAKRFLESMKVFALAESLGGVESLIEHPALMTHASVPKETRDQVGLTESLIRVSVGIEHIDDLIADFDQAFQKIA